jgi:bifunctional DNase/RNase
MPIVILKDSGSSSVLPIWVGIYEANAIALEIEKVSTPRPMTHDLIKTLLTGLDAGIRKVVVSSWSANCARIRFTRSSGWNVTAN